MASNSFKRGEIWEVDFEPQTHKSEPGKRNRPALIIQTDLLNHARYLTTIVIPATTQVKREKDYFPLRISIQGVLELDSDLLVDQIRTISNARFIGDKPLAVLSPNHLKRVEQALKHLLVV